MTWYLREGNNYRVTPEGNVPITKELPVGTYVIKLDPQGYYLERIEDFTLPAKLYGNTLAHSGRIFNTFKDRSGPTGVMLTGEKGSGKTLLAKHLSITSAENGYSTIIVNAPFTDDGFHTLIQNIDQPAMVLFDEFEKVYDSDDQQTVLTMLDGIFNSKKLFILTCNDRWRVDVHMRNRPGRLYYMLDFEGLDTAFVREYCEDNLNNKEHIEKVCAVSLVFDRFNFDMLKAIVEEMNRYNETPQQVLRMINARPEFSNDSNFDVKMFHNKREILEEKVAPAVWEGNPLSPDGFEFNVKVPNLDRTNEKSPAEVWNEVSFFAEDLVKIDPNAGTFTFTNEDKWTVVLTRQKAKTYHYIDL